MSDFVKLRDIKFLGSGLIKKKMVKVLAYTSTEEYADQDIGNFIFSLQDYLKLFTLSQNARSINIIFVNLESNL